MPKDTNTQPSFSGPNLYSLEHTYLFRARWWGKNAQQDQCFWSEPCLSLQLSTAWPWLRISSSYRLRTNDVFHPTVATVDSFHAAARLLASVIDDIKSFPLSDLEYVPADPFDSSLDDIPESPFGDS